MGVADRLPLTHVSIIVGGRLREGRGHYCAQELLSPVPLEQSFRLPIRGTSFFFLRAHEASGCLLPRPELASRYPEDVEVMMRADGEGVHVLR